MNFLEASDYWLDFTLMMSLWLALLMKAGHLAICSTRSYVLLCIMISVFCLVELAVYSVDHFLFSAAWVQVLFETLFLIWVLLEEFVFASQDQLDIV